MYTCYISDSISNIFILFSMYLSNMYFGVPVNAGTIMPICRPAWDRTHGGYEYKQCFSTHKTYCGCVDENGKFIAGTIRLGGNITCDRNGEN